MSVLVKRWCLSNTFQTTAGGTYPTAIGNQGVVEWDSTKFDGISAIYFEAQFGLTSNVCAADGTPQAKIDLYDYTNTASIVELTEGGVGINIQRSADISGSMPSGTALIGIRIRATRGSCAPMQYNMVSLVIVLENSTKWREIIHLGGYLFTSSTSYVEVQQPKRFLQTDANWDGTDTRYFAATIKNNNFSFGADTWKIKLRDFDGAADITNGELTGFGLAYQHAKSSALGSLNDGNNHTAYYMTISSLKGSGTTIANAYMIIDQSDSPTKTECHHHIRTFQQQHNNTTYTAYNLKLQFDDAFSGVTQTLYHEGTAKDLNAVQTWYMQITDDGTAISGSEVSNTGVVTTRVRSSSLTEPADASVIEEESKASSSANAQFYSNKYLYTVTGYSVDVVVKPKLRMLMQVGQ